MKLGNNYLKLLKKMLKAKIKYSYDRKLTNSVINSIKNLTNIDSFTF